MKPLFIALTFLSSLFFANSHAIETVPPAVLKSFKTSFHNVKEVNWEVKNNVHKAAFVLGGQNLTAFYNAGGKLLSISKKSTIQRLPFVLQRDLKKFQSGYNITEVVEISSNNHTDYYVVLESATKKTVLKSADHTNWTVYTKICK